MQAAVVLETFGGLRPGFGEGCEGVLGDTISPAVGQNSTCKSAVSALTASRGVYEPSAGFPKSQLPTESVFPSSARRACGLFAGHLGQRLALPAIKPSEFDPPASD